MTVEINMTWHNAYLNLIQAKKIIFIGYSLPDADYHFRTLLRRAINPDAKIVVVLSKNDKPKRKTSSNMLRFFAKTRYQEFFGTDRIPSVWRYCKKFRNKIRSFTKNQVSAVFISIPDLTLS